MGEFSRAIIASFIVICGFMALGLILLQIFNATRVRKQRKHFEDLHQQLAPGCEVMLASGLYGRVTKVTEEYVMLTVAKGVEIKASRYSIQDIFDK